MKRSFYFLFILSLFSTYGANSSEEVEESIYAKERVRSKRPEKRDLSNVGNSDGVKLTPHEGVTPSKDMSSDRKQRIQDYINRMRKEMNGKAGSPDAPKKEPTPPSGEVLEEN